MNEFKNGTSKINMSNTVISDISVTIFSKKTEDEQLNQKLLKKRIEILEELGIHSELPSGASNYRLFYEDYIFPKEEHDRIKAVMDKYAAHYYSNERVNIEMNCLYDYNETGTITLDTRARISDPCYYMESRCAGSLDVLPGTYKCFCQRTGDGRVAAIKVVHEEYDPEVEYEPNGLQDIDIEVNSGKCGIYDEDYFAKNCKNIEWFKSTFVQRDVMLLDDKAFISSPGDGSYECSVVRNSEDKIVAIKITFLYVGTINF